MLYTGGGEAGREINYMYLSRGLSGKIMVHPFTRYFATLQRNEVDLCVLMLA